MGVPFEAAKGVSEKVLMVKFPVLMRVVLPGLLATVVLYRSVVWALWRFHDSEYSWERLAAYAALVFVLGSLISTLNSEVYKVYEGRILWPPGLFELARGWQQARIKRLRSAAQSAHDRAEYARYNEIWYQLRIYPLDDHGQPEATYPTLLGNVLAGYEQYPDNRYGMDSVFYWPRIWLQLEKDKKEEIDSQWSVADGFLTLSVISLVGGALWIGQSVVASLDLFSFSVPLKSPGWAAVAGLGWLLLGYLWYRLSLPFHRENGEVFKSIFDIYRNKVWDITCLRPQEKETWNAAWAYLQYLLLRCPKCGKLNPATSDKCESCGFGLTELTKTWQSSGKFPM